MAYNELPPHDLLLKLLDYNPATGLFVWKPRTADMFRKGLRKAETVCLAWNIRFADRPAFFSLNSSGHLTGTIDGQFYLAHRIAWKMVHGDDPAHQIDHINGDPTDNRICNLRSVESIDNSRNRGLSVNNKTGVIGVCWSSHSRKWMAQISDNWNVIHLGGFDDFEHAVIARKAAEKALGFHRGHGKRDGTNRIRSAKTEAIT